MNCFVDEEKSQGVEVQVSNERLHPGPAVLPFTYYLLVSPNDLRR